MNRETVQQLREATGAGVMECKVALEDAGWDFEKAIALIRERGISRVEKRSGREAGAGFIHSYVHGERIGVLVDLRAETDFVVRSDPFRELAHELAMQIAAMNPETVEVLLAQPSIRDANKTVEDAIKEVIAKVGENVKVNSFSRLEV